MIYVCIIVGIVIIDICMKVYAEKKFVDGHQEKIIDGKLSLKLFRNDGAFMGVFKGHVNTLKVISATMLGVCGMLFVFSVMMRKATKMFRIGIAMIMGGAISNLADRIIHNYVVDYLCIAVSKTKEIIVNIGDIFIFAGSFVILIREFCKKYKLY